MMGKVHTPPARWFRRFTAWAPVVCVSLLLVTAPFVPGDLIAVSVAMTVVCGALLATFVVHLRTELAEERHTSPAMQARYERLAALLAAHHDQQALVPPESDAVIVCVDERGVYGSRRLEFQRFARTEVTTALFDDHPLVYDRFCLVEARPVVIHRLAAATLARNADDKLTLAPVPVPTRRWWQRIRLALTLARNGADVAAVDDLDVLITQIQAAAS
jgi:hypothetical protein